MALFNVSTRFFTLSKCSKINSRLTLQNVDISNVLGRNLRLFNSRSIQHSQKKKTSINSTIHWLFASCGVITIKVIFDLKPAKCEAKIQGPQLTAL